MVILVGGPVDVHFVDVLYLEGVSGFEGSSTGGVEHVLSLGVSDVVRLVAGVVWMLHPGVFDLNGEVGKVLSVLRDDLAVNNGDGDGVFFGLVLAESGESVAFTFSVVDEKVDSVFGLSAYGEVDFTG